MKKFLAGLIFLFAMTSFCVFADDYAYSEDYETSEIDTSRMSYIIKTATGGFGGVKTEKDGNNYYNFGVNYNDSSFAECDTFLQTKNVDISKGRFVFCFKFRYDEAYGNGGGVNVNFRHADNSQTVNIISFAKDGTCKYLAGLGNNDAVSEKIDLSEWHTFKCVFDIPNDTFTVMRDGNTAAQRSGFINSSVLLQTYNYSKLAIRIHASVSKTINEGSSGNYVSVDVDDIYGYNDQSKNENIMFGAGELTEIDEDGNVYDVDTMRKGKMRFNIVADSIGTAAEKLNVLSAVYDENGKMIDLTKSEPMTVEAGGRTSLVYEFDSKYNDTDKTMKLMFISDTDNISPIAAFRTYNGAGNLMPRAAELRLALAENHPNNSHPRLWVSQDKFDELKVLCASEEPYKTWYSKIISSTNKIIGRTLPSYDDTDELRLSSAGTVCSNLTNLSFAYKMTGDEKYINEIKRQIDNAASWVDWNPKHFLDTAAVAQGFGFAYDWCYDYWQLPENAAYKEKILTKINDYALEEAIKKYEAGSKWSNNWSMVCNGGIAQAAVAVMDEPGYEMIASRCVAYGLDWLLNVTGDFAPDGGWYEGTGYWSYLMQYMSVHFETIKTAFGTDYDYTKLEGISNTGYFPIAMIGNKQTFNMHDAGAGSFSCPYWFYLAKEYNNSDFANYRYSQIKKYNYAPTIDDLLWFDPELVKDYDNYTFNQKDFMFEKVAVATFRDDYFENNTMYAAIHGGKNSFAHGQIDVGNFIYEYGGVRWAVDLGGDNYNLYGYFNTSATAEKSRWAYYRNRGEGHNTVILNPGYYADQPLTTTSEIKEFYSDDEKGIAVVDMQPVMDEYTSSARRGMYLDKTTGNLIIRDEISFDTNDNLLYWFMHTSSSIELSEDKKSAILTYGTKKLWVGILDGDAEFTKEYARPLETSPNPDEWEENMDNLGDSKNPKTQNANDGITKLQIKKDALSGDYSLTVLLAPLNGSETVPANIPEVKDISSWK